MALYKKKVVKVFNKYFCPNCNRYFGKETSEGMRFEKEEVCLRCSQPIYWPIEGEKKIMRHVEIMVTMAERHPVEDIKAIKNGKEEFKKHLKEELSKLFGTNDIGVSVKDYISDIQEKENEV